MTITSIEQFIATHLPERHTTEYCRTEAKILNSFLKRLVESGYSITYVNDGLEPHDVPNNDRFFALEHIFSVERSFMRIGTPDGWPATLYLLIGEGESRTIYDCSFHEECGPDAEEPIFKLWAECVKTHDKQLYKDYWQ